MKEAVLHSGEAAERREPYTTESANDLLETHVYRHPTETPSGRHPVSGGDDVVLSLVQGAAPITPGVPAPLLQLPSPDAPAGCEAGESSGRRRGRSGLLLAFLLLAAVALIAILALCSYAARLIARTAERMGTFWSGDVEKKYLDEMRRWTALAARLLNGSAGDTAQ